jgi:hypothetical protein
MNFIQETLVNLSQKMTELENSTAERNKELEKTLSKILEFIRKIEESWSGHWFKPYARLYFYEFQKPPASAVFTPQDTKFFGIPRGWMEISLLDIENTIEELFNFNLYQVQEEIFDKVKQVAELQNDLCVELSVIKGSSKFNDEVKSLEEIEKTEWYLSISDFIKYKKPKTFIGSFEDIQRGFEVPPHIEYQSRIVHLHSGLYASADFIKKSKNLIRRIQIKETLNQEQPDTLNGINNVIKICNTFHAVARQLRERHNNRNTLKIADEYDVQDLFHGLLQMFFNDIRPEEWTPSYAGGSSRVDFLLRPERIVIEIKKTRKSLGAKEVGNQLLIDIARYQCHPDCKNLICFVYDPEGIIANPKGLEDDLNLLSNDKINIVTLIRPLNC